MTKLFYYNCSTCCMQIIVSESYYRKINTQNPERICRICQLRKLDIQYKLKWAITETGRACVCCGVWKEFSMFPGKDAKRVKHNGICKDCRNQSFKTKWGTDPEFKKITQERAYKSSLKIKYGITPEQHQHLLEKFNYKCYICNDTKELCIDHCHVSKKIRGILCRNCNKALGIFKDNKILLDKAKEYLDATSN